MSSAEENIKETGQAGREYGPNREEYINALENSVKLLQLEVERLRNQRNPKAPDTASESGGAGKSDFAEIYDSSSIIELLDRINARTAKSLGVFDSSIYLIGPDKNLTPVEGIETSLGDIVTSLEEEGFLDWAAERTGPSVVPNLYESGAQTSLIITPLSIRNTAIAYFIGKSDKNEIIPDELDMHKQLFRHAAITLDNITSSYEIKDMNRRLSALNRQMAKSASMASIGELAGSIAREIVNPVNIVKANLGLIELGLDDSGRRVKIIKEQINIIEGLNGKLLNLADSGNEKEGRSALSVESLISEALLFAGSQFLKDGINLKIEPFDGEYKIIAVKRQLEQALLEIILYLRNYMPEGGEILFSATENNGRIIITISDNGIGIEDDKLKSLFLPGPFDGGSGESLYFARNIIEQNGGRIQAYSELEKGSAFKLFFRKIDEGQ